MSTKFNQYLNRAVVVLTMVAGLAAAVAVPVANLDLTSTLGVMTGVGAIAAAALKFLSGWQAHEVRVASDAGDVSHISHTGQLEGRSD